MNVSEWLAYRLLRRDQAELIDMPGVDTTELAGNLRDLSAINRVTGGVWLSTWAVRTFVHSAQVQPWLMLDIGCGLGDIPRALCAWAARRGLDLRVVATDISPQIVAMAAQESGVVTYAVADGLCLPFSDASVDLVHCSFTLHHFAPQTAVQVLREMRRVARRGVIINDIVRSWPGIAGAWLLGHMLSTNRLTRHDGLASARRAYTQTELRDLAAQAGMRVRAAGEITGYRAALALE